MYWLVLIIASSGYGNSSAAMIVIPEKYPTELACKDAGRGMSLIKYECIKASAAKQLTKEEVLELIQPVNKCVTNINSGKLECN